MSQANFILLHVETQASGKTQCLKNHCFTDIKNVTEIWFTRCTRAPPPTGTVRRPFRCY